jgi:HAMP domain-containing protein
MKKTSSINRKLMIGLSAIIVFFVLQAVGVMAMGRYTEQQVVDVARKNTVAQVELAELSTLAQQIRRYEKEFFIYVNNPERRANYNKEFSGTMEKITGLLARMRANESKAWDADDLNRVNQWTAASEFYNAEMNKVFAEVKARAEKMKEEAAALEAAEVAAVALKSGKSKDANSMPAPEITATRMLTPEETNDMIKAGKDRFSADLIKSVTETFTQKSQATLALTSVTNEGFNQMIYGVIATVLIGIAIGAYLLISLPHSVTTPIRDLTEIVDGLSRGETSQTVNDIKVEEFKGLAAAVERMRVAQDLMIQRLRKAR